LKATLFSGFNAACDSIGNFVRVHTINIAKLFHVVKRIPFDIPDFYGYIYGMARPPKDPSDRKTVDVRVPMTEDQKKLVAEAAAADQADVAAWARPILLNAAKARTAKRPKRSEN